MVTVAIIGCGKYTGGKEGFGVAYAHANGWRKLGDVTLWGVDVNAENLANFGEHYGLADAQLFSSTEALYDAHTPDFVSICTWPGLHADMVVEAAERGVKGIACEKPMALTTADIQRMEKSCKDKGVALCIAHQRRYNPFFERAKRCSQKGGLAHLMCSRLESVKIGISYPGQPTGSTLRIICLAPRPSGC